MKLRYFSSALCLSLGTLFHLPALAATPYIERTDVQAFIREVSERNRLDPDELQRSFAEVQQLPAVIKAILPPANPQVRSWRTYRSRFVEPKRIRAGLRFWQEHGASVKKASVVYGVPEEIIVAIIGIETIYGRDTGKFNTFAALTTLAFDYPPRAELFRRELEALLLLARDEKRSPLSYKGSFAGALGLPQFLPSSVRHYAVDFDHDGHIDLLESPDDAIGSVANFLKQHGWEDGGPIVAAAQVDAESAKPLLALGIKPQLLPSVMQERGVSSNKAPEQAAALIDLITPDEATEYWLGYQNFYVITRYNRSSFYAMSVHDFAQKLKAARK